MRLILLCLLPLTRSLNVTFQPDEITLFRTDETRSVEVHVATASGELQISASCQDPFLCKVVNFPAEKTVDANGETVFNITIRAEFLGLTELNVRINSENYTYPLRILRSQKGHFVSIAFAIFIGVFVVIVTFMMGTQLKVEQLATIFRRPIGPTIGFFCQYGLMPVIGFLLAEYGLSGHDVSTKLALFAVSTCPGGGKSSFWTIIFGGNLDLSITMTFFQTIAALFMMPLWLKTLGTHFMDNDRIIIPFVRIIQGLVAIAVPSGIGTAFTHFRPQYTDIIHKWIKRVSWMAMIVLTIFAVYTNYYMIWLLSWPIFFCGCALPWLGYIAAFSVALILRQPFKDVLTIAIETGIQNIGIAMILMYLCLPEPESDISITVVFVVAVMTDKPLIVIWLVTKVYKKWIRKDHVSQKISLEASMKALGVDEQSESMAYLGCDSSST